MFSNVFTKAIRDRWIGTAIAGAGIGVLFVFAMLVYRDIDLSIYDNLPEFFRAIVNIPEGDNAGILAYSAIYGTVGAIALAGFAISLGSGSIAGEERNGTLGLLLGNPRSRGHVLLSKLAALVVLVGSASLLLWLAGVVVPPLLDVDSSIVHPRALIFHMFVNALFYGLLAALIGAWTGSSSVATGATAGILGVSFLASGILPIVADLSDLARVFPWYYYDSSQPLNNGVDWSDLGVLLGLSAVFAAGSIVGLSRRDLKNRAVGSGLLGRLSNNVIVRRVLERFAGNTRVSHVWVKTIADHRGLVIIAAALIFLMAVMIGAIYPLIDDMVLTLAEQLPDALLVLTGGGDLGTPEGFFQLETFGLMGPIVVIAVAVVIGARALAGEEQRGTMGLLLANPIRRSRIIREKTISMIIAVVVIGVAIFAGTMAGSVAGGLDLDVANVAAIATLMTLVGLVFGALALAIGGFTGRPRIAIFGSAGAAFVFYVLNSFLPLSEGLAESARVSPFYYYLSGDPLVDGLNLGHAAILVALAAGLIFVSSVAFGRRDIRN